MRLASDSDAGRIRHVNLDRVRYNASRLACLAAADGRLITSGCQMRGDAMNALMLRAVRLIVVVGLCGVFVPPSRAADDLKPEAVL